MMNIIFRGESIQMNENDSLDHLLKTVTIASDVFAVAVNSKFIPKAYYSTTTLYPEDVVDIILPMQGG